MSKSFQTTNHLLTLSDLDSEENADEYAMRVAARAIVVDQDGKIALLYVNKDDYYKIPGGGVEEGEDIMQGLVREVAEEAACEVIIEDYLGDILEYRKIFQLKQVSHCYVAKVVKKLDNTNFTKNEIDKGFELIWTTYDEALKLMNQSQPRDYHGKFLKSREIKFLTEYGAKYSQK